MIVYFFPLLFLTFATQTTNSHILLKCCNISFSTRLLAAHAIQSQQIGSSLYIWAIKAWLMFIVFSLSLSHTRILLSPSLSLSLSHTHFSLTLFYFSHSHTHSPISHKRILLWISLSFPFSLSLTSFSPIVLFVEMGNWVWKAAAASS